MSERKFLNMTKAEWKENWDSLVWAVALALAIRTFVIAPFKIPSSSMNSTLLIGDRILVSKFIYNFRKPQRGDIVVFYYPNEWHPLPERLQNVFDPQRPIGQRISQLMSPGRPFIKRLVGMGGDRVEIREGKLFVNGTRLDEPAIFQKTVYRNDGAFGQPNQVIEVPADALFVLGDNSSSSHDSRYWGFVPRKLLIGEAVCIFWPVTRWRLLR